MIIPDYELVCENLLYTYGFSSAISLSKKISVIYKLLSEILSNQDHYDFGMRSIKSIIILCGQLKKKIRGLSE